MTKAERYQKYVKGKVEAGQCVYCGKEAITRGLCEYHRQKRKAYQQAWREKNKDKVKKYARHTKEWRRKNKSKAQEYRKKYYLKYKAQIIEKQREYRKRKRLEQS